MKRNIIDTDIVIRMKLSENTNKQVKKKKKES